MSKRTFLDNLGVDRHFCVLEGYSVCIDLWSSRQGGAV
jgi:hypothetical protein